MGTTIARILANRTCQKEYFCKVIRHIPTCGLQYVPEEPEPRDNFVIGESYSVGQRSPSSRDSTVIGGAYSQPRSGGSGNPFVIGSRHGDKGSSYSSGGSSSYSSSSSSGGYSSGGRVTSGAGSPRSNSVFTIGAASNSRYRRSLIRKRR